MEVLVYKIDFLKSRYFFFTTINDFIRWDFQVLTILWYNLQNWIEAFQKKPKSKVKAESMTLALNCYILPGHLFGHFNVVFF